MTQQRRYEIILVYVTGLMQGLVLVTLPAVSAVFTGPHSFGFSKSQYGAFFVPQVLLSIVAALLAPWLAERFGPKRVYQAGLILNAMAMALMAISPWLGGHHMAVYVCMLMATAAVGAGFGATLPMINVYAQRFFPDSSAAAITGLHTLLGTGTAVTPLLAVVFMQWLHWWLMPLMAFCILLALWGVSLVLPLQEGLQKSRDKIQARPFPGSLWLFIVAIFLYGYCETIFANWAVIYLNNERSFSAASGSYALAMFWAMVTIGRLLTSLLSKCLPPPWVYRFLPFLIAGSLWMIAAVDSPGAGIFAFGCAGVACSAFFPLSFSFAQKRFAYMAERVSGSLMASYMLGYGVASFGIGKFMEISGISLQNLYRYSVPAAIGIGLFAWVLMCQDPAQQKA